jgi:hypothetical protein
VSRGRCLGALLLCTALQAQACGVCATDKVAATYDYHSVQQALAQGRVVVYCDLAGVPDVQRARHVAARLRGVEAASVRVSASPAALSFVLDPKQQSPQAALLSLRAGLPRAAHIALLKVESPSPQQATAR